VPVLCGMMPVLDCALANAVSTEIQDFKYAVSENI
jgi:hypothetical protein